MPRRMPHRHARYASRALRPKTELLGKMLFHRSPVSAIRSQHAPEGHSSVVQRVKEKSSVCSPCFYCLRGSFPSTKINELRDAMDQHQNISEKLLLSTMFEV